MRLESRSGKRFPRRHNQLGRRQVKATPIPGVAFIFMQIAEKGPSAASRSPRLTAAYNSYASFAGLSRVLHLDFFEQSARVRITQLWIDFQDVARIIQVTR